MVDISYKYRLDYKGPCYNYFPWNDGGTWADNVISTTGAEVTTAVPSANYYTVPYDCFINYWAPSVQWNSSTSYEGRFIFDTTRPSIAMPTHTTRVYTGDEVGPTSVSPVAATYETFSNFTAANPLWVVALYKNPTNLSAPGTQMVSINFSPTLLGDVGGVFGTRWPNADEMASIISYSNTNSNVAQLAAGDKLVCVVYRNNNFCSKNGSINGSARGFFLQQSFNLSFSLKLARR